MKEKNLDYFKDEVSREMGYPEYRHMWPEMVTIMHSAAERYANHLKAIALQEGRNEDKWVPFSKNHPTIPEEYLVTDGKSVSTMTFDGKSWLFEAGLPKPIPMTIGQHLKLTHWMPLPQPPTK